MRDHGSSDDHVRERGFFDNRDRVRGFLVNRVRDRGHDAWTRVETVIEGGCPLNAAKKDMCGRGSGMLQEADSGKVRFARQEIGDLNEFFGDRDRNRGSGICVRERGARGGASVEIASHQIGREGGSRQKIVREDLLGISFGKIVREGARLARVESDGNTQRNSGEIRSRN